MRRSNDYFIDMDESGEMNDRDVERLLRDRAAAYLEDSELARFLRDFNAVYPEPSVGHCEAAHLSAILAAAHQLAEVERTGPEEARDAAQSGPRASGLRLEGRYPMKRRFPRWLAAKLTVPVVIALLTMGGVALAGGVVYHQMSTSGETTELTQPGPDGTGVDAIDDQVDSDDQALDQDDQDDVDEVELNDEEQNDQDDADEGLDDADDDLDDADDDLDDADDDLDDADDDLDDADNGYSGTATTTSEG